MNFLKRCVQRFRARRSKKQQDKFASAFPATCFRRDPVAAERDVRNYAEFYDLNREERAELAAQCGHVGAIELHPEVPGYESYLYKPSIPLAPKN